ncbi:MAG TPA: transglutaminase family protein [Candidatus Dormibacteraeota bacterium]|nr:transglutaminase family protein [Candidatus Dormibacteraeota bacterium]
MTDAVSIDWTAVRRTSYLLEQTFRYEYPSPIRDLAHRLVVIPPERFGDQVRLDHRLLVAACGASVEDRVDRFGNFVHAVFAPVVRDCVEFTASVRLERWAGQPHRLADGWLHDGYLLEPTALTVPDRRIHEAAAQLCARASWGLELAEAINDWVYQSMTYNYGSTGVRTSAAEALALGHGVCQDYAHLMLSLCRACSLPARYVSGHLVGEGGTHAWVEVVLPAGDGTGEAIAWTFDPTHASRGGLNYVTVAVGGDYSDVAPTSGTYVAPVQGRLQTRKRITLTEVEFAA